MDFLFLPLLISLPFLKKEANGKTTLVQHSASASPSLPQDANESEVHAEIYKTIISRYQNFIEESESKSISELKELVKPHDKTVLEVKIGILDAFHPYVYDDSFLMAAQAAMTHLSTIHTVPIPLNFWLSFDDMERIKAADSIDRAVFLCSILRSLDNDNARVYIAENKKPYVLFEFKGQAYLIDVDSGKSTVSPSAEAALKTITDTKLIYSFNDKIYEDLSEQQ